MRKPAEAEVRDSGRLIGDMVAQVTCLAQAFQYFGGLADKTEGAVLFGEAGVPAGPDMKELLALARSK